MSYRGHNRNRGGSSYQGHNNNRNNNDFAGNSNFNSKMSDFNNQNKIWIEIQGWTNASKENLVSFISRKTNIGLKDVEVNGPILRGSVYTQKDAQYLESFNGIKFAGDFLKISALKTTGAVGTIDLLRGFLRRRFMPEQRLLDLTHMGGDQELVQNGLFSSISTSSKMFTALMKLATEEPFASGVDSLNLSQNSIVDGQSISILCQTYPFLKNLSLAQNNIALLKSMETFRNKLNSLSQLIVGGNPIANDPAYRSEMLRLFPRLLVLDSQPVRDESKLKEIWKFPLARAQFFFENPQIQSLSTDFISNFLNCWDSDRSLLAPLYTPDSQFSVSVDLAAPFLASGNDSYQDKNNAPWDYYLPISRNMTRITSPQVIESKVAKGNEKILGLFQNLPKTKHSLATNPEKFSSESWKINDNSIMIVLHGEFEEVAAPDQVAKSLPKGPRKGYNNHKNNTNSKAALSIRTFDRSWFIVSSGGSFVIASDLLCVKPYAGTEPWTPSSLVDGAAPATAGSVTQSIPATAVVTEASPISVATNITIPPEIASKLSPEQQDLLIKIMAQTKLNINYAGMLAEQSAWDLNQAVQNFNVSKANIPPNAYM